MRYFREDLGAPRLAKLYAFCLLLAAATVGNFVQVNALVVPSSEFAVSPVPIALCIMVIVALIVSGGLQELVHWLNRLVPAMALLYLGCCVVILAGRSELVLPACREIIAAAFGASSLAGGLAGFTVMQALVVGFDRGLLATDTGLGLEAIVHSTIYDPFAGLPNHVAQGLISLLSPLVVPLICLITGLTFMVTGIGVDSPLGALAAMESFRLGLGATIGPLVMLVVLFCFAFTTMLTWYYCGEKTAIYLWGKRARRAWRTLFILLIPCGALIEGAVVWTLADYATNVILAVNTIGLALLSPRIIRESRALRSRQPSQVEG